MNFPEPYIFYPKNDQSVMSVRSSNVFVKIVIPHPCFTWALYFFFSLTITVFEFQSNVAVKKK